MGFVLLILIVIAVVGFVLWKKKNPAAADAAVADAEAKGKSLLDKVTGIFKKK